MFASMVKKLSQVVADIEQIACKQLRPGHSYLFLTISINDASRVCVNQSRKKLLESGRLKGAFDFFELILMLSRPMQRVQAERVGRALLPVKVGGTGSRASLAEIVFWFTFFLLPGYANKSSLYHLVAHEVPASVPGVKANCVLL